MGAGNHHAVARRVPALLKLHAEGQVGGTQMSPHVKGGGEGVQEEDPVSRARACPGDLLRRRQRGRCGGALREVHAALGTELGRWGGGGERLCVVSVKGRSPAQAGPQTGLSPCLTALSTPRSSL